MNIIFLDINGVLIDNNPPFISNTFLFNSEAMTNLSKLIETTNSKIVISSNWKIGMKNPNKRVQEIEWQNAFSQMLDSIIICPVCGAENFYIATK